MKKLGEIEIVLNRATRMFIYAACSGLFVWLAFYYIRLGIFGALVSSYLFFDVWIGVTKRLPGFWRGLRYWQKGAIAFGLIHLVLFLMGLVSPYDFYRHSGEGFWLTMALIEFPYHILMDIKALFVGRGPAGAYDPDTALYRYYSHAYRGTLAYAFWGALFGLFIDVGRYLKARLKKRG